MNNSLKDSVTSLQKSVNGLIDATKNSISNIPIDDRDYLCFTACSNNGTIMLNKNGSPTILRLEYSTNKVKWEPFVIGQAYTLANAGDKIWLRNTYTNTNMSGFSTSNYYQFVFTKIVEASGNILSLLYSQFERMNTLVTPSYCFYKLFSGNTWTLKTAPKLPSTSVGAYSYSFLFEGCRAILEAPELPATTLQQGCYYGIFQGCTGIRNAPYLPATTLVGECYRDMFNNCSQISRIRVNFSTFDDTWNTYYWVSGVASNGVFECPSALEISRGVSNIPDNWTIVWTDKMQANWEQTNTSSPDYIQNKPTLFSGDYNDLTNKPVIPEDSRDYLCFTALESNSTVAMETYNNVATTYKPTVEYSTDKVTWHTLITNATPDSPVTLANVGDKMWVRGDNAHFSANNTDYTKFVLTGKVNVSGNIMSLLDKSCKQITLPTASEDLQSYVFASLFYNNSALVDVSELELPAMTMVYGCYYSMFRSCSNLVNSPKLPATTLDTYCYGGMFRDCTSLTEAPYLPVNEITGGLSVYNSMFRGCSSLKRIKVSFTSFDNNSANWMQDVPATGIFECPSALNISTRGTNTVPAGWTIVRTDAPWSDWTQTDATESSYIKNKPEIFSGDYNDLTNKPTIPDPQVQADWDESDSSEPSFILNKPVIPQPSESAQADWDESDSSEPSFIRNKPTLFSGSYNDLNDKPTIPAPQVQTDWDESDSSEVSFILNKPVIPVVPENLQKYVMTDDATSSSTVEVSPSGDVVKHITVASALTLSATSATGIAYAEIVLDISAGATVTAGTGITLVDTPEAGKSNVCVVRWSGGTAKLYVTIVEDLPQA